LSSARLQQIDSKDGLLQFGRYFVSQQRSANSVADQQRPIRMDHILQGARRVSILLTFNQTKAAQLRFLRPKLSQPSFWSKASGLHSELSRCGQRSSVGPSLSTTDDSMRCHNSIRQG